jgi:hypothetical protein
VLFVLYAYLLVWVPANFAILASRTLPSLAIRSRFATVELMTHGLVALACAVSGWMLRAGNPAGRPLAMAALIANALATAQSAYASTLPHDLSPGLRAPLIVAAFANAGVWVLYLALSTKLRCWLRA